MKQRTSHPAQQCPLVVAIDKLSCCEIKLISEILSVHSGDQKSEYICKKAFILYPQMSHISPLYKRYDQLNESWKQ